MKRIVLIAIAVLSLVVVGNAFALDDNPDPAKRSTNMFIQEDDGPSIKALIGSDNVPIVDDADIRNPNFVGDRGFSAPQTQNQNRDRSIQSPGGVSVPTGKIGAPTSPVKP